MLAYLIGLGQRSSRIPALVAVVVILAIVNTDWLGWFRLNRYVAYVCMIAGACIAILEFFSGRQVEQLYSVANLLVYVQIPLMFQSKDQRIFDHWGIFLMLEMVVASLLNDNLLFGLLLVPVLIVGCSAMMSLAAYSSIQQGGTSSSESAGLIPDFFRWLGQEQSWARRSSGIKLMGLKPKESSGTKRFSYRFRLGWFDGLPIGLVIALFALIYFFALPRLHTGAYEGLGRAKALAGFSGVVSLDDIGELMSNDEIAMRITMSNAKTKRSFQPIDPPYVRGTVVDTYDGTGRWHSMDLDGMSSFSRLEELPSRRDVSSRLTEASDQVLITVSEQAQLEDVEFSLPPFLNSNPKSELRFTRLDWGLRNMKQAENAGRQRHKYEFETVCYFEGQQTPFLIDSNRLSDSGEFQYTSQMIAYRTDLEAINRSRFPGLIDLASEVLAEKNPQSDLERVLALEEFLSTSPAFTYSLLPQVDRSRRVDPIEDFATRHRTGHCQFFASTLAIMLRSQGIPSRIVLGFRPPEYNEVGRFLVVRQNHAHSWVEAWIDQDQLQSSSVTIPDWVMHGAWVRLDPTPKGENSNAGGSLRSSSGQAFQAVEQLWQDLVIDMDSSRQSDAIGIFAMVGNGAIGALLRSVERELLQLQTQNLDSVSLKADQWFSWKSGLVGMTLAIALTVAIRFRSRFSGLITWQGFLGLTKQKGKGVTRYPVFFLRLNSALASLGLRRSVYQTPLEFAKEAEQWLLEHDFYRKTQGSESLLSLALIVNAFYNLRYGDNIDLSEQDLHLIGSKITAIEKFAAIYHKQYIRS